MKEVEEYGACEERDLWEECVMVAWWSVCSDLDCGCVSVVGRYCEVKIGLGSYFGYGYEIWIYLHLQPVLQAWSGAGLALCDTVVLVGIWSVYLLLWVSFEILSRWGFRLSCECGMGAWLLSVSALGRCWGS